MKWKGEISKTQWILYKYKEREREREYSEQLYTNKSDNVEKIDNFLETNNPPKFNQQEIENLNQLITWKETGYKK